MKRALNRREKILIGVLAVAGGVAYRSISGDGIGFGGPSRSAPTEQRDFGQPPVVRMDLLQQGRDTFDGQGRDLFAYYVPPPPPPKYRPPAPTPPPPRREIPPPPRSAPPPPAAPVAPQPTFTYLGYLGPKDQKIAVFDGEEGVLLARVGETVQKQFRMAEFKHDSVTLTYTDPKWKDRTTELKLLSLR